MYILEITTITHNTKELTMRFLITVIIIFLPTSVMSQGLTGKVELGIDGMHQAFDFSFNGADIGSASESSLSLSAHYFFSRYFQLGVV